MKASEPAALPDTDREPRSLSGAFTLPRVGIALALYVASAIIWLIPDSRIEKPRAS